jgi:DNA-binding MarR family transcriptional regulator
MRELSLDELMVAQRRVTSWRREFGLSANEAAVLLEIHDAGVLGAAHLSRTVGISTASMSRMLARLERDGWIVRSGDEDDGRRLLVQPSKRLVAAVVALAPAGRSVPKRGVRRT